MGDLYLPESGIKVNRLEQPFHLRGVYCLLLHIWDGQGSVGEKRWNQWWWL